MLPAPQRAMHILPDDSSAAGKGQPRLRLLSGDGGGHADARAEALPIVTGLQETALSHLPVPGKLASGSAASICPVNSRQPRLSMIGEVASRILVAWCG